MSELSEAIQEMRNMRESYDQIGAAAEAYNTGKAELAANITAKGVQASANETLPELAEKVAAIMQETYEINGGEMYAKQLFGSLETPNYWNLYDIMAQLLSDGRLVNYGGILLAEYYKGYDSLALIGAGAGGAYVVSDKDGNGNFILYTEDTTHTWNDAENRKGNRFVAYCFAEAGHNFDITDTNTSPRSIYIGRNVGTIKCFVNTRITSINVTDGNVLQDFNSQAYSHSLGGKSVIRNVDTISNTLLYNYGGQSLYVSCKKLSSGAYIIKNMPNGAVLSIILEATESCSGYIAAGNLQGAQINNLIIDSPIISGGNGVGGVVNNGGGTFTVKNITLITESCNFYSHVNYNTETISLFYKTNDKTKSVGLTLFSGNYASVHSVYIQDGWCKPLNISKCNALTEENIVNHILNKLGDNTGQEAITITLGATNLAKLTEEEKAIATNKGFTLA